MIRFFLRKTKQSNLNLIKINLYNKKINLSLCKNELLYYIKKNKKRNIKIYSFEKKFIYIYINEFLFNYKNKLISLKVEELLKGKKLIVPIVFNNLKKNYYLQKIVTEVKIIFNKKIINKINLNLNKSKIYLADLKEQNKSINFCEKKNKLLVILRKKS
ncbi:hypothetical protein [Candidatus Vidania fulgoroideorum]